MFKAIADGFGYLFGLLGDLGLFILSGLEKLFKPVLDFLGAIFYFLFKLGLVLVKVISLVISLAKLLIGLGIGLFKTIAGLSFSGTPTVLPASYQGVFAHLQPVFAQLQLDKLAYIFIFAIWIGTVYTAIKIIGGMRGGAA